MKHIITDDVARDEIQPVKLIPPVPEKPLLELVGDTMVAFLVLFWAMWWTLLGYPFEWIDNLRNRKSQQ